MRRPRIKAEGAGYYHAMSRIIERRHLIGDREKKQLLELMRSLAAFGGLEILTHCFMDSHFHILLYVPERRELSDDEFLDRFGHLYGRQEVELLRGRLRECRAQGDERSAEALKASFTYRMYDIGEFFKALKQRFSQTHNAREGRCGPLWEQRFKSVLVEGSEQALITMAAYIDLNPVRAGVVTDPKDYRYSGYGEAMGGSKVAREGLRRLMQVARGGRVSWGQAQRQYRQRLYVQGRQKGVNPEGKPLRQGFTAEEVSKVLLEGGRLPMSVLLRCRVRYFSDGLALGSGEFLERVFHRYRGHFGPRRRTVARPMRFGDWGGLCTLRDLRLNPVSP